MIKKDVIYNKDIAKDESVNENESIEQDKAICSDDSICLVDAIFAAADETMCIQNNELHVKPKEKKKKKKHRVLKILLIGILVFAVLIGALAWSLIKFANNEYPKIKEAFLFNYEEIQNKLQSTDDSTLSVDEYYQKRLLLLFSVEEIEQMINSIEDIHSFSQTLLNPNEKMLNVISQEKREEYLQLLEEYKQALKENANDESTSTTLPQSD